VKQGVEEKKKKNDYGLQEGRTRFSDCNLLRLDEEQQQRTNEQKGTHSHALEELTDDNEEIHPPSVLSQLFFRVFSFLFATNHNQPREELGNNKDIIE
jgi:hypothetical protein